MIWASELHPIFLLAQHQNVNIYVLNSLFNPNLDMDRLNVYECTCYKIINLIQIMMSNNIPQKPFI
jgi:hypothetical protein